MIKQLRRLMLMKRIHISGNHHHTSACYLIGAENDQSGRGAAGNISTAGLPSRDQLFFPSLSTGGLMTASIISS
jgi:hypothetical protein